jgi:phosphotriesterase-related protein
MKRKFKYSGWVWALFLPCLSLGQVITVNGPIRPEDMGLTLIHEHVMVDWVGADSTGYHRWNREEVVARALPYLGELKEYGVRTFLDCTPAYLGRDPWVLKRLSDQTGINILTNTGYYGSGNNKFVPRSAGNATPEEIAAVWIGEFREGIDGSGIRPGFLKMSVEDRDTLSAMHEKLVRAAALTHLETGLSLVSHTGSDGPAMAQLKVLKEMGVAPEAFVWTHAQNGTLEGYLRAARLGAWISLDHINAGPADRPEDPGNISWYVETLARLKAEGLLGHILISHDAGWYNVGQQNGGNYRGYTDLFTDLIPQLRAAGFTQDDLDLLLVENPRRAYALQVRRN